MIRAVWNRGWLMLLCAVCDAAVSVFFFSHAGRGFHSQKDVLLSGKLIAATGLCAVAAAIWNSRHRRSWLLLLNGVALAALGLLLNGLFGSRISLRAVSILLIVSAVSTAALELQSAHIVRRDRAGGALTGVFGAAIFVAFALMFFAVGFGGIQPRPESNPELLWFGSYFAFSAVCMLSFGLGPNGLPVVLNPVRPDPLATSEERADPPQLEMRSWQFDGFRHQAAQDRCQTGL